MLAIFRTKTFWSAVAGMVVALGGFATGEVDLGTTIQTITTGLVGIFLRQGLITSTGGGK
jgi:hypothetical protein